MTFWHLVALAYVVILFLSSRETIKKKRQFVGVASMGFSTRRRVYREGDDAVKAGRLGKYTSIFLLIVLLTDVMGLHDLSFYVFVADMLICGVLCFFLIPTKSSPLP